MSRKITAYLHLSEEQLRDFQAGTLPEEHTAEAEAHLQSCVVCCEVLSELPEDNFLLRVRCACKNAPTLLQQGPLSTPPPQDSVTLPETSPETTIGERPSLPGYEVVRELGRGGMGIVYAATHGVMGRRVAIKVIHPEFSSNPVAVERFHREVLAAARLSHPNIVTAFDAGEDGGRSFLVMEHIDGETLGDRLSRLGPLPVPEACNAVRQAALGVQHAHDHGLIHRDLKPHNLMRTADGTVKVGDFGLASLLSDRSVTSRATAPNAIMGTPDYMAPEQAENARAADGRADVYALGCTLYHLLTGRVPFPEESVLLKLVAHRTQSRPSASRLRSEIPAELDGVLRRAMARKPASRYQTPGDFAKALEPFADPAQCYPRRNGRKRIFALAALILSLAVALVGVVRLPTAKDQDVVIQTDAPKVDPEQAGEVLRWSQGYRFIHRIAVSPDGQSAWTAGDDASHWDLDTGKRLEQIGTEFGAEEALPSPDGKMLLLAEPDSRGAKLYDVATLKPMRSLRGSPQSLAQAAWLPDGRLLTGGNDSIARLWDARTGEMIREFRGHTSDVDYVDVNRDGTRILTFSFKGGELRIWDPDDGKELWQLSGQAGLALFAPDGKSILIGGPDGVIRRIAYPSGTILRSFRSPDRRPVNGDRLCLMPDGRHFLSAGSDRVLRLWDLQTGRELYQAAHPGQAISIAVTPDGRYALLGTDFGSILKWRLPPLPQSGERIAEERGDAEKVGEVRILGSGVGRFGRMRFLPDGERVLAGGDCLSLWNTRTGEKIREFTGPSRGGSYAVNISRNGRYALAGFHLVDLKTGEKVHTLEGGEDSGIPLWGAAFSPDGSRAVLGGEVGRRTGTLWVADLKTGKPWKIYDTEQRVRAVAYSPDGTCIAAGQSRPGISATLRVYKVETGEILHSFNVPNDAGCIAFSPDGNQLVSAHDKTLYLWDLKMEKEPKRFEGHTGFIEDVVFTPDGQYIVSAAWDATVRVWSLARGEAVACFRGHKEGILGVSVSADGLHAVSGSGDHTLRLWRLPSSRMGEEQAAESSPQLQNPALVEIRRHVLPLAEKSTDLPHTYAAAFSPDGTMYAVGGDDGLIRIWNRQTGQLLHILRGHTHWIGRIAFTPDGKRLISSSSDRTLRVWDTAAGRELQKLPVPKEGAGLPDISPDGKYLVANCGDNTVRIWDLQSAQEVRCLKVGQPCEALFVADGQRIVTRSGGDTLKLWDAATGSLLATQSGPPHSADDFRKVCGGKTLLVAGNDGLSWRDPTTLREVRSLKHPGLVEGWNWAVSPDGRFLIVAGQDEHGARLWDLEAGEQIDQIKLSSRPSGQMAFAPDGRHIAAGSFRGFVYLLRIEEKGAKARQKEP